MMGLTPGPLVRALFPWVLTNMLVVSVAWGLTFFSIGVKSNFVVVMFVVFVPIGVDSKGGQLIEMFWGSNS